MSNTIHGKVLIIDDEETVRESVRLVLAPPSVHQQELATFSADLFEVPAIPTPWSAYRNMEFTVHEASTGKAGLELVSSAVKAGDPYSVIFVDMRMPEWDGLETVQRLREIDMDVEIIFLTAYSDHTVDELIERAGPQVGFHLKPFAPEELKQITVKAIYNWNKIKRLQDLIDAHRNARRRYLA